MLALLETDMDNQFVTFAYFYQEEGVKLVQHKFFNSMTQMTTGVVKFVNQSTIWFLADLDDRILNVKLDTFNEDNGGDLFSQFQVDNGY